MTSKARTPRKSAQSTRKRPANGSAENASAEGVSSSEKAPLPGNQRNVETKPDHGDRYQFGRRVWPD